MSELIIAPRFVDAVRAGTVRQSIRVVLPATIRVGDHLRLRRWRGRPKESPLVKFGPPVRVTAVRRITLDLGWPPALELDDTPVDDPWRDAFARAEGYIDAEEFFDDWRAHGILAIQGVVIEWEWPGEGGGA